MSVVRWRQLGDALCGIANERKTMKPEKKCKICGGDVKSQAKWTCSLSCRAKYQHQVQTFGFKKGVKLRLGKKHSKETLKKISGKNNHRWSGDNPSYSAIHKWVSKSYPKSGVCEKCKLEKKTDWANKTGQYKREERDDWIELCRKCHIAFDMTEERKKLWQINLYKAPSHHKKKVVQ